MCDPSRRPPGYQWVGRTPECSVSVAKVFASSPLVNERCQGGHPPSPEEERRKQPIPVRVPYAVAETCGQD